jgi:carboxyl-terminal processing protease
MPEPARVLVTLTVGAALLARPAAARAQTVLPAVSATATTTAAWVLGGSATTRDALSDTASPAAASGGAGRVTGSAVTLRRVAPGVTAGEFGSATALAPAAPYRGKRARLRAEVRTDGADGGATLWIRVDGPGGTMIEIDNAPYSRRYGTTGWAVDSVTVDVPAASERIAFGALLSGGGEIAARGVRLVAVEPPPADAPVAAEARRLVDSALAIARTHSLWRDTISWDAVAADMRRRLAGASGVRDAYPVVAALARRLGDHHSFFMAPTMGMPRPAAAGGAAPVARAEPDVETRWLARERVGYLRVPAHGGGDPEASRAYVVRARTAIAAQRDSGACGWVVDLRTNGGGNMWPMLGALRPLLGEAPLGAFRSPTDTMVWSARGIGAAVDPYGPAFAPLPDLTAAPVAVLTGPRAASSGEAVATAFRGRPATRTFGTPTAGLSTANRGFSLPGGGSLVMTVSVYVDRTGKEYGHEMLPDEQVAEVAGADAPLDAALAWLARQPGCAAR